MRAIRNSILFVTLVALVLLVPSAHAKAPAAAFNWSKSARSWSSKSGVLPAQVVRRGPEATLTRGQFLAALRRVETMRVSYGARRSTRSRSARWLPKRKGKTALGAKITSNEAALATASMLGLGPQVGELSKRLKAALPGERGVGSRAAAAHALIRTVGLRYNVEDPYDRYELGPRDSVNVAHGAYMLHVAATRVESWRLYEAQRLASTFELPQLGPNQRRVLGTAVRQLGQPYVWAGETEDMQAEGKGGFDCSGFTIRVINNSGVPGSQIAPILERTTYTQSAQPKRTRITKAALEPGDAVFFGERGTRSKPAENYHAGVYMGNGWFIHSSGGNGGVAINRLDEGYWGEHYSWGRRALHTP